MNISFKLATLLSLFTTCNMAFAGGPLVLEGKNGNTPVSYQNPNITIHAEGGALGTIDNNAADTIMQEAFALWNNVDTATINISLDDTAITADINISNFENFIPNVSGTILNADDGLNPVVYDNNGEIIDAFFGVNASLDTIGFAASVFNLGGNFFIEGYAVINGRPLNPALSPVERKLLVTHEIGHLIGLDHSQVDINNQESISNFPGVCQTETQEKYPVMYPFVCRNEVSLHADDISSVSTLYPAGNFNSSFGSIEGRFVDSSNNAILGANIWAENTSTGEVVSIVSDYLNQGDGLYKLHLTPGNYTLHANSINKLFNGGSSIGPHAVSLSDKSFIAPHPITEVALTANGNDEVITVSANIIQTINLSSGGNRVILSSGGGGSSSGGSSGIFSGTLSLLLFSLLLVSRRYHYLIKATS
jgi:hypothetical protein